MNENTERNLFFGALAVVIAWMLWHRHVSAASDSPASAAGLPTITEPAFTPTYLNYNQAPYDNRPQVETVSYAPVNANLQPLKPLSNPKLNNPSCGCGCNGKKGTPRVVAIFGSGAAMDRYYTTGAGKSVADAWSANMPTSLVQ